MVLVIIPEKSLKNQTDHTIDKIYILYFLEVNILELKALRR
jgi:hypothetical protein